MSTAPQNAGQTKQGTTWLIAEEFVEDFPRDEAFVYRNHVLGLECLITIPKKKIAQHWLAERAAAGQRVIEVHPERTVRSVHPVIPPAALMTRGVRG